MPGFSPSAPRTAIALVWALYCSVSTTLAFGAGEVNIYSARQEALIKPLLDEFTAETGITVNLVTGKGDALLTRLQSEGRNSPADVLLTTDAGRLYRAQEAGVLQTVSSDLLNSTIPENLRSSEGYTKPLVERLASLLSKNASSPNC
jgi:iron(III) transport system substrate-binding protein